MSAETCGKPRSEHAPVCFEYFHPTAQRVCAAGSVNGWDASAAPMVALGHGHWRLELWLPPGQYEYLLVVDGQWTFDPSARDYMPNVFGGMNAVIEVPGAQQSSRKPTALKSFLAPIIVKPRKETPLAIPSLCPA
jgi:1,4-alpha-glucan branching enzyme